MHDTNYTILLSGIQLQSCYWKVLDIDIHILKSNLSQTILNVTKTMDLENQTVAVNIVNSTILHLIGSNVTVNISNVFIIGQRKSNSAMFILYSSKVVIENSWFQEIHVKGDSDEDSAIVYARNSQIDIKASTFVSNSAFWSNIYGIGSTISVVNSHFEGNQALQGGSLNVQYGSLLIVSGCKFLSNMVHSKWDYSKHNKTNFALGGAISATDYVKVYIATSYFIGNHAWQDGGAIKVDGPSTILTIDNCVFHNNKALNKESNGGAIFSKENLTIVIQGSEFLGNQALLGGAVSVQKTAELVVNDCLFLSNIATDQNKEEYGEGDLHENIKRNIDNAPNTDAHKPARKLPSDTDSIPTKVQANGGAIVGMFNVSITILYSYFSTNTAIGGYGGGYGGAVFTASNAEVYIEASTFLKNNAGKGGAFVGSDGDTVIVKNSSFENNFAIDKGGALFLQSIANVTVGSCLFENNYVENTKAKGSEVRKPSAGAISIYGNSKIQCMMQIANSKFISNSAINGLGGVLGLTDNITVQINGSVFNNNSAEEGAVISSGRNINITITDSKITNNTSNHLSGFLTAMENVTVHIKRCLIFYNGAPDTAVIYATENSSLLIEETEFTHNGADTTGLIAIDQSSRATIAGCNFTYNGGIDVSCFSVTLNSTVMISDTLFSRGFGQHLLVIISSEVRMQNCTFLHNHVTKLSSGNDKLIYATDKSTVHIENCTFASNRAYKMDLFGITESTIKLKKTIFKNNLVLHLANILAGKVDIAESTVINNYACGNGGLLTFHESTISFSHGTSQNNTVEGNGAVIFLDSCNISISHSLFFNNSALQNGGSIFSVNRFDYSTLAIVNSSFSSNHALVGGAVLSAENHGVNHITSIALDSCTFTGNSAKFDSALSLYDCSILRTSKSRFSNQALEAGKNLIYIEARRRSIEYLTHGTDFTLQNSTLNSSVQNFLEKAQSQGFIRFYNHGNPYNISNTETPYAAGT